MKNGCIFLISARHNLLKKCLELLDKNYNNKFNYPILIFYHDNIYDDQSFRDLIFKININTKYSFHKVKKKIPDNLSEKELFWNLNNRYAINFGKKRLDYLHANYFWNNFMNFKELKNFDYLMRIDDDSWFKKKIEYNLFEELDKNNGYFGTGFTWNNFSQNHLDTRYNLFNWIKYYVKKYNVNIKDINLKKSLNKQTDNKLFHTLKWSLGNLNIYNSKMFKTNEWKNYNKEFNKIAGGYRYRWGDIEVIGLFCYIHLENPLIDFNLNKNDLYSSKLPGAGIITK